MNFKEFVASGASDEEVDRRIRENATQKDQRTGKQSLSGTTKCGACGCANCQNKCGNTSKLYVTQFCHPASKVKFFSTFTTWKKESSNPNAVELVVLFQQIRSFP
jgi:hypothetical protein